MSDKDLQFIERALAHPWMFWVYFWKWPRIVRQACAEYDLLAKERDTAKAAYERSERANKLVRDWIHVTHRLSTTPEAIRAIFAAGKRLSILLAFFIATNAFSQAPPYLRNQWTTNANPIAVKVISTNGVQAATNVWELDFTNTASVSVNVVSNAGKVMLSFIGATNSGGSGSIVGATNLGLEMSGAQGLFTGTNNQLIELRSLVPGTMILFSTNSTNITISGTGNLSPWTNYSVVDSEGGTAYGSALSNSIASPASIIVTFLTNAWGSPSSVIIFGVNTADPSVIARTNFNFTIIGDLAGQGATFTNNFGIIGLGPEAMNSMVMNDSRYNTFLGSAMGSAQLNNLDFSTLIGFSAGNALKAKDSQTLLGFGNFVFGFSGITNCTSIMALGNDAIDQAVLTNCALISAVGSAALAESRLTACNGMLFLGAQSGTNIVLSGVSNLIVIGNLRGQVPTSEEFWFGNTNNVYRMPGNIGTIRGVSGYSWPTAHTAGVWTNDGTGVTGWKPLSEFSGGSGSGVTNAIGSIYTNNVLAGGPGLTELGFTNSSTVRVAATTNAGRSTVSYDARTNDAGVFVVQGTTDNGLYVAQSTAIGAGSIRLGFTSPKLGLERPGAGHFIHYSTSSGDTTIDAVFGGAKVNLAINGTTKWQVANAGHFLATTDNTVDIGASGATRPRNVFIAGNMVVGGGITNDALTASTVLMADSTKEIASVANAAGVLTNDGTGVVGYMSLGSFGGGGGGAGINVLTNQTAVGVGTNLDLIAGSGITILATNLTGAGGTNAISIGLTTALETRQVGSAVLTNLAATRAVTNMTVTTITNVGVSLYTVPAGCTYIWVECIGGGGGGGGVDGAASQSAAGGGGGSGAYCSTNIGSLAASYIVTVGTNGLGGVGTGGNAGTIGGTTLFTNILTALGGSGGSGKSSAAAVSITLGGAGALETATGRVYTGGNPGHNGICVSGTLAISGGGAGSHFGGGGAPQTAAVGANATGKGAGGSGAAVITNADRNGGNGSPGVIVIREFYQ